MNCKVIRALIADGDQFVAGDVVEFKILNKTYSGTIVDFDTSGKFIFVNHTPNIFDGDSRIDCFALKDIKYIKHLD